MVTRSRDRKLDCVSVYVLVILLCTPRLATVHGQQQQQSTSTSSEEAGASGSSSEIDSGTYTLAPHARPQILSSTSVSKTVHEHVSTSSSFSTSSVGHAQRVNTNVPVPVPVSVTQVIEPRAHSKEPENSATKNPATVTSTHTTVELISPLPVIPITIDIAPRPQAPLDPRDVEIISTIPPESKSNHGPSLSLPVAEIYLAGLNDELTLLTNLSNSEILIDRKYIFDSSRGEFINIVLVCTAPYPIRWTYAGDGAPTRMYSSELRTFEDFHNESSYEYFTTLVLMQERNNEHLTGTYSCEGVEDPHRSDRVFYRLYFPGGYGFPTIRNRVIRPDADSHSGRGHVTLPCETTNPKLPMTLYKIHPKEEAANLTNVDGVSFDPKIGFTLDLSRLPHAHSAYGTYYCSLNDADSFWKMDVVPRKEDEVSVFPSVSFVPQSNFAVNTTFRCAAKEPVTLSFPQGLEYAYGVTTYEHESSSSSSEFPYAVTYKIDPSLPLSSLSPYFQINCVSNRTKRILHNWEHSRLGPEQLAIKFDASRRRVLCCSASGLATVQEIVKCETKTDCEIKKKCFQNGRCEYPFPPKFVPAPPGCTAMEFMERVPTHVIKCSVGEVAKIVTVVETIDRNDVYIVEEDKDTNTNGAPATPATPTDLILKIGLVSQSQVSNEIRVKCSASLYFFSTSLVFAMENVDGSFEYLNRDLVDISDPYEPVLVTQIGRNTRRVHCFAPLAGSSEWRNVSLPVLAVDPTTTTTPRSLSRGLPRGRTRLLGG